VPSDAEPFDPVPLIEALARGEVDFVVIGGVAGGMHGSSYGTYDLDIAYARNPGNLQRLVAVLAELGATLRGAPPGLPFQLDAKTLANGSHFTFSTRFGSLDILSDPDGAPKYDELRHSGDRATVRGHTIVFASLDHLIAMKEASRRPKDLLMATEYRILSDRLRAPDASG
jgi:hypothetical protein